MQRRRFLGIPLLTALSAAHRPLRAGRIIEDGRLGDDAVTAPRTVKLFLCGDVMTGRGIDQILPHPSAPEIHEPYMTSAAGYVKIAERANGPIPRHVDFDYIWGDALSALRNATVDVRIINLETAVTQSDDYWPGKGINYRMHPANLPCLTAAGIDCCALANNHVLDWGYAGLHETLASLRQTGIHSAGAGANSGQAMAPGVIALDGQRRVLVFSMGSTSSGIGGAWAAGLHKAGVWLLDDLSRASLDAVARQVAATKQPRDIAIASIHWGGNWGYAIARGTAQLCARTDRLCGYRPGPRALFASPTCYGDLPRQTDSLRLWRFYQ